MWPIVVKHSQAKRGQKRTNLWDKMSVFSSLTIQRPPFSSVQLITPRPSAAPISPTSDVSMTSTSSQSSSTPPNGKSWTQFNEDNPSLDIAHTKNYNSIDNEESRELTKANKAATTPGKNRYPCQICDKVLKYKDSLNYHMKTHSEKHPFTCWQCNHSCKSAGTLKQHIKTHLGVKSYSARYVWSLSHYHHSLGSTGGHTPERRFITVNYVLT